MIVDVGSHGNGLLEGQPSWQALEIHVKCHWIGAEYRPVKEKRDRDPAIFLPRFPQFIDDLKLRSKSVDHTLSDLDRSLPQFCFWRLKNEATAYRMITFTTYQYLALDPINIPPLQPEQFTDTYGA